MNEVWNLDPIYKGFDDPAYVRVMTDTIDDLGTERIFEVNTGAIARGYRTTPYPAPFLLKEWKAIGGEIVISSDCHDKAFLNYRFNEAVEYAKSVMPDLVLTSDVIVGFPGETEEEFEETLDLVRKVRYDAMFTFIYSPREGTPAAKMPDPYTREEKQVHFARLVETANEISAEIHHGYEGKDLRVLVDGQSGRAPYNLTSRTEGGRLVHLQGDPSLIGSFVNVHITSSNTWALFGEIRNETN